MSEYERPNRRYLFTVRLWLEELGGGGTEWRGQVQSVHDGERYAFRLWSELVAFFNAKLAENSPDEED